MSDFRLKINDQLRSLNLSSDFSLKIGVVYKGKTLLKESFGKDYKYFDLASLTKAIFTSTYCIETLDLNERVRTYLPWVETKTPKLIDLLSHTSGLKAHEFFYKTLNSGDVSLSLKKRLRDEVLKSKKQKKPTYSDLGYLLLGFLMEEVEARPLKKVYEKLAADLAYPKGFHFIEGKPKFKKSLYAPTEDKSFRGRKVQAEVFDGNAYMLGGVASHAGLFGSLEDMLMYAKVLRGFYIKHESKFKKYSDGWSCGFMMPSGPATTAGKFFSKKSIGHLAFTGCSFWYDPKKDLYVVILSNRTYPDRSDFSFNALRPVLQDLVYKEVIK